MSHPPAGLSRNPHRTSQWPMVWTISAVLLALLWLWINFCRFPDSSWNDIRLVPVFMAAAGESVYTLPGQGVITTWMYGPVPLWLWSPAWFGADPLSALLIADGVNLALTLIAIGLTCAFWPVPGASGRQRWLTFAFVIALWPDHAFRFLQADNIAIAFGLMANLLLVSGTSKHQGRRAWLAAGCTVLALGCKQNTLGLLLAQWLWLTWRFDWKTSLSYLTKVLLAGGLLAGIAIAQFGYHELWYGTVGIASALPWSDDPWGRLLTLAPILAVQWGLPLLAMGYLGRKLGEAAHPLALPLLACWGSLPLGLIGLLSTGGSINNLQGLHFLAPALVLWAIIALPLKLRRHQPLLTSVAVAIIICARIMTADRTPWLPAGQMVQQAVALQKSLPHQIWLPWNPLVSYFGDHRFYHAEDGLYVRFITGHMVSVQQAKAHLPRDFHAMAFPNPQWQWGVAAKLAPADHQTRRLGSWQILWWPPPSPVEDSSRRP